MIFSLFRRPQDDTKARLVYDAIMAQARQPAFYEHFDVPDTLEGRYEMLMLHAFLYMHRLKSAPEAARSTGQTVFDLMFVDMDRALREIGVGDLSVPKKIKKMASAFYGRTAAYDAALAESDEALAASLQRNVYGSEETGRAARSLVAYVRAAVSQLGAQDTDRLIAAAPVFPNPVSFAPVESAAR